LDLLNSGFYAWDNFWENQSGKRYDSWAKRRIVKVLSAYIEPGMDVLDLGCGTGFFSAYFISRGSNVYSMDYSRKALSIAKGATNGKSKMYLNANILDDSALADINVKFDIVFTDGLLEHYSKEEQGAIMHNMKLVKKEQGYIINFVPNKLSLWSIVRPFVMNIEEEPFIMREVIELHRRNGLSVISFGGINVLPFRISPERLLARRFGMLFYCVAI